MTTTFLVPSSVNVGATVLVDVHGNPLTAGLPATLTGPLGRAADAASVSVALSTEDVAILNGAQAAGENHIGEVGGNSGVVQVALTVTASSAYASGNSIGGKMTIANAVRAAGHGTTLQNIVILDRANQSPAGNILIFNADPTNATLTDKTAFVFSTDDLKVIARIPVASSDYATINSKAVAILVNLGRVLAATSGTSLFAAFVTTSTPTFAATTDVQLSFAFLKD